LAFPVLGFGWLYGGLMVGAVGGLIASVSLFSSDLTFGEQIGASIGILALLALIGGIPFVTITGQSFTSVLAWVAGVMSGGIVATGLASFIVIAVEVSKPHPFPESEPSV
jgi:hypothetical protein